MLIMVFDAEFLYSKKQAGNMRLSEGALFWWPKPVQTNNKGCAEED